MEVLITYPLDERNWIFLDDMEHLGLITPEFYYDLGITPQDPKEHDCCYFNITVFKKKTSTLINPKVSFYAEVYCCYKVRNNNQPPTVDFFFALIENATQNFAEYYYKKVENTIMMSDKIQKPKIEDLREDIERTIDIWNRTIKDMGLN